jgi:hypothetical protein
MSIEGLEEAEGGEVEADPPSKQITTGSTVVEVVSAPNKSKLIQARPSRDTR